MRIAITRDLSPAIARCELTHFSRQPIDLDRARAQHAAYEQALADAGCDVQRLEAADLPDAVFIEDVAIVFDELAVITRPGADSRRGEIPVVADAVAPYRPLRRVEAPGTIDGGDVLVMGRTVFVGRSSRTNASGVEQLRQFVGPLGYTVVDVTVHGCLHLKSAVTGIADNLLLINDAWVAAEAFSGFDLLHVDPDEPWAANALRIEERAIYPSSCPRTGQRLAACGIAVATVDVSELAKAEGAVTCCSLVFAV